MTPEVIIALPSVVSPVVCIRSTLIQSSLNVLRSRGYFERYMELLDPQHREDVLGTLAPEWLSIETGRAHYAACDALALGPQDLHEIGEAVGERIQGAFISTMVRRARTMGLVPWVVLGQFERLWGRLMQGGAVGVLKTGPKDCTVEVRKLGLAQFAYFRVAFCGVIASGIKLGAGKAVTVKTAHSTSYDQRCLFKCSWV